jgi:catechol 2,3-dioxygenase-like lactoylglutathione lyase family enzyme
VIATDVGHIESTAVLVIGGGPAGLASAAELGLHGIDCLVLEPRPGVTREQLGAHYVGRSDPRPNFNIVFIKQDPAPATAYHGPGGAELHNGRAPGFMRPDRVRRKLGHVVVGSADYRTTASFFTEGLGFKVSDRIKDVGAFMRCSTDHHNVPVLAAPVNFLHPTSWQVDDIDDVGRGAFTMLEGRPERHVWGLGRHHAGSNFFWYLKDRRRPLPCTPTTSPP